ncbi:hypothetical protein F5B17DRAFT_410930 [Nemania serpens]|nr:hypothetical protein F5B17DRAFT_410930 [Nemania serpens]
MAPVSSSATGAVCGIILSVLSWMPDTAVPVRSCWLFWFLLSLSLSLLLLHCCYCRRRSHTKPIRIALPAVTYAYLTPRCYLLCRVADYADGSVGVPRQQPRPSLIRHSNDRQAWPSPWLAHAPFPEHFYGITPLCLAQPPSGVLAVDRRCFSAPSRPNTG